mgnify:CR=1 FL=1
MEGAHDGGGGVFEEDFNPGADAVAVGFFAISGEVEGDEVGVGLQVVAKKPYPGRGAVGDPDVEVAIVIVIDEADGAGVVGKVPADGGGDVGEASAVSAVEEGVVGFTTAEGFALMQEAVQGPPTFLVAANAGEIPGIEG